jgi:hypothetical protein
MAAIDRGVDPDSAAVGIASGGMFGSLSLQPRLPSQRRAVKREAEEDWGR